MKQLIIAMFIAGQSVSLAWAQGAQPVVVAAAPGLTAEGARVALDAAEKAARTRGLKLSLAVVDAGGHLLAFRRMDGASLLTVDVVMGKARSAVLGKGPTGRFMGMVDGGMPSLLSIENFSPLQGGVPILVEGAVVGAIAGSGAAGSDDEWAAQAGADAVIAALARPAR